MGTGSSLKLMKFILTGEGSDNDPLSGSCRNDNNMARFQGNINKDVISSDNKRLYTAFGRFWKLCHASIATWDPESCESMEKMYTESPAIAL